MKAAHVRCLATWPFGHRWVKTETKGVEYLVCTRCQKESDLGKWKWMGWVG